MTDEASEMTEMTYEEKRKSFMFDHLWQLHLDTLVLYERDTIEKMFLRLFGDFGVDKIIKSEGLDEKDAYFDDVTHMEYYQYTREDLYVEFVIRTIEKLRMLHWDMTGIRDGRPDF